MGNRFCGGGLLASIQVVSKRRAANDCKYEESLEDDVEHNSNERQHDNTCNSVDLLHTPERSSG
jgi:hypothetical protein